MKTKNVCAILMAASMAIAMIGCGSGETQTSKAESENAEVSSSTVDEESSSSEEAASGDTTTIEFWYHDGNDVSNAYWAEIISKFEDAYPQYKVNYTGLPSDSYSTKYTTSVATGTAPDVLSVRDTDMATMIGLGCMTELTDIIAGFEEAEYYNEAGLEVTRSFAGDGGLYCLPLYATVNICWANTALMEEKGIAIPSTQSEMLADCEQYADPANNKYFFTLRGGSGSTENIFDWIFTYAGVDHLFEEDGTCVLSDPVFAEALDKYASIYWNGWTSSDSLTNDFTAMVAEFGSETAMFMMHNSSSYAQHLENLGEGNFMNVKPLSDDNGKIVTKGLSCVGLAMINTTEKQEAAEAFMEFVASEENDEYICSSEGRIPLNELVYESSWFKDDPYNAVYSDMTTDENISWLTYPFWLSEFSDFQSSYVVPGWQSVLLKERTSEDVLQEWADFLTTAQQNYLAATE